MLSVDEAQALVAAECRALAAVEAPLAEALGRVLAEDVASDVDTPPHDKSIVDGYAVVAADLAAGAATLDVLEEVTAGSLPTRPVLRGQATRLMTGAPLPEGADAVVKVEQSTLDAGGGGALGRVSLQAAGIQPGRNVMRRAASVRRGELVLRAGATLRAVEVGLLAEVGRLRVRLVAAPRVAVAATGNELVPGDRLPAAGQIRNSNGPMMAAAVGSAGAVATDLGIVRDEPDDLRRLIRQGLTHDVLLLSGGVSAGVLDLVPGMLRQSGVREVFHKLRLKPGRPLWFGVRQGEGESTLVFGLPGNPVSTLVCFELFVRPALAALAGRRDWRRPIHEAALTIDFAHRGDRPSYHPALLAPSPEGLLLEPLAWRGSGDLRALASANSLAMFPPGDRDWRRGERISAIEI